ncbi:hypothetical protein [Noviherbaspirillum saxi]|uniref:Uncharacterized protein n=1 Tax=Noviherbaspirillum saxi TaxID=2320863 RepID=A0A3A3FQ73_9BURK|nr:hypothetical protein [Noviherbaspirillum saxi]RJF97610.1 hypothetical protein D3871_03020 [Noviherbaspirillum saxi]
MKVHQQEILNRLAFIDRTIIHAAKACHHDENVPMELRNCVFRLRQRSRQAQQALRARDESRVRQSIDDLTRISDEAQHRLHPSDGMTYALKSAVILTHIELSALQYRLA